MDLNVIFFFPVSTNGDGEVLFLAGLSLALCASFVYI